MSQSPEGSSYRGNRLSTKEDVQACLRLYRRNRPKALLIAVTLPLWDRGRTASAGPENGNLLRSRAKVHYGPLPYPAICPITQGYEGDRSWR